jgi:TolB-like protein
MSRLARLAAAVSLSLPFAVAPAGASAQSDDRPVVAVLYFDNRAFGKAAADYENFGKGVADLLTTDLAEAGRVRVVERERIQSILAEQDLVKAGSIDQATAVRIGKLVGAQYVIMGSFITSPRDEIVLTSRTVDLETSVISNPQKVQSKGDDVLALVAELSGRLQKDMKLPARAVGGGESGARQSGAEARPSNDGRVTRGEAGSSKKQPRMDVRTSLLYAKALDEQDRGNSERATELYRAVLTRVPDYEPAKAKLAKLEKARS